jgi:hypothetical protein
VGYCPTRPSIRSHGPSPWPNHYLLDAIAGLAVRLAGYGLRAQRFDFAG